MSICIECHKEHDEEFHEHFCCEECKNKTYERYDWEDEHSTLSDDALICPYCGYEHAPSDHPETLYDENLNDYTCGMCSKPFYAGATMTWTWTATAKKEFVDEPEEDKQ